MPTRPPYASAPRWCPPDAVEGYGGAIAGREMTAADAGDTADATAARLSLLKVALRADGFAGPGENPAHAGRVRPWHGRRAAPNFLCAFTSRDTAHERSHHGRPAPGPGRPAGAPA